VTEMITDEVIVILALLAIKHFLIDFVFQTNEQVKQKGVYGNLVGITHSFQHGVGTIIVFLIYLNFWFSLIFAIFDSLIHYHIDWIKSKFGEKDITKKSFWIWFGGDQLLHWMTYIWFIWILL